MSDGEPQFSLTEDRKGIETEKFITHKSWRRYVMYLEGPHWDINAGCRQREWLDPAHMPRLGFVGGML